MKDLIYCKKCECTIIKKYAHYPYKYTLWEHLEDHHEVYEILRFMDRSIKKYKIKKDSYYGNIISTIGDRFNNESMFIKRNEYNDILYLVDNIKYHYRNYDNLQYFNKIKIGS